MDNPLYLEFLPLCGLKRTAGLLRALRPFCGGEHALAEAVLRGGTIPFYGNSFDTVRLYRLGLALYDAGASFTFGGAACAGKHFGRPFAEALPELSREGYDCYELPLKKRLPRRIPLTKDDSKRKFLITLGGRIVEERASFLAPVDVSKRMAYASRSFQE